MARESQSPVDCLTRKDLLSGFLANHKVISQTLELYVETYRSTVKLISDQFYLSRDRASS